MTTFLAGLLAGAAAVVLWAYWGGRPVVARDD